MISNNVPHSYKQDDVRHFIFFKKYPLNDEGVMCANVEIFDASGYSWFSMCHVQLPFVEKFFWDYAFRNRKSLFFLEVFDDQKSVVPNIPSDAWIQGSPDRGYALEILREGLGLNLTYLNQIFRGDANAQNDQISRHNQSPSL